LKRTPHGASIKESTMAISIPGCTLVTPSSPEEALRWLEAQCGPVQWTGHLPKQGIWQVMFTSGELTTVPTDVDSEEELYIYMSTHYLVTDRPAFEAAAAQGLLPDWEETPHPIRYC
jgi:hypothetical protein